jgi:hypothetical protein
MSVDPLARLAMAEAALAEAAKMTGLMRERAQKAEADRDEWIRWSVEQDGVRTDNLIREKERAERAEQRVRELEAERDQYKFLLTESHSSDHYRAEKAEAEAARYRAALNEELEARAVSYRLNPAGRPPAVEPETIDLMVALKESIDAERELGE